MAIEREVVSTGWSNGLSQDYNEGLGRWFADRLGARQELRMSMLAYRNEEITIGRCSDGITLKIGNQSSVYVNQEDDMAEALKEFLYNGLGFVNVEISEDY